MEPIEKLDVYLRFTDTPIPVGRMVLDKGTIFFRQAIKNTTGLNFKDFINKYRIEYSVELMKAGFLINGIISSLGEKSGFESKQTYCRAFKKFKNSTPASYWKERLK